MQNYEQVHLGKKKVFFNNLLGGIAWGIGATLGASIILYILGFVISKLDFVPVIGDFVLRISEFVEQNSTR